MECATNQVVAVKGFIGSQEVAVVNRAKAEMDWATYSEM